MTDRSTGLTLTSLRLLRLAGGADPPDNPSPTPRLRRPTSCAARTWSSSSPTSPRPATSTSTCSACTSPKRTTNAIYLRSTRGVHPPQPRAAPGPGRRRRRVLLPRAHPRGPRQGGRLLHRARLPRRAPRRRLHQGHRRLGARRGPARASRTSSSTTSSTSSASRGATTCYTPGELVRLDHFNQVTPDVPRAVALHGGPRVPGDRGHPGRRGHGLRRLDAPQAHRARHRDDRRRRAAHAPRRLRHAREAQHPRDLRQARRAAAFRPHRARPRPPRRLERVLPLPARPRRAPRRDLHPGLLHRRPRQPGRHLGRARQPAPRLVGQPGRAVLVHRGLARARPRRQPAAGASPAPTPREMAVTIGADGFSYTRQDDERAMPSWKQGEYKLGHQL